ncbi:MULTISPECIES: hypothetical protein [Thalassospira]|uniref:Uncharacterized protein n=1 Tax=Thalassospira profundimaris TaxID=502049 RepID=A0A367VLL4_9PROT|nr:MULTISPECIES: hypothetical protein [Thalassospira]KZB71043.1 hypothetical protein AUQ43_09420 [Thalassospira sp. MCCC 1A01148]RCK25312.1 hypothetical protein TH6_01415 [Thalassospira profundimaris]
MPNQDFPESEAGLIQIPVKLDGKMLVDGIVQDLGTPGMTPVLAIERALEAHIYQAFSGAFSDMLIKPPTIKLHSNYFKRRFASLAELVEIGYETWYFEVTIATRPENGFDKVMLAATDLELIPISYGWGVSRVHQVKVKKLKKQTNHLVRINHIRVGAAVIRIIMDRLIETPPVQPMIANFDPVTGSRGMRIVSFDHMVSGQKSLCECARTFHSSLPAPTDRDGSHFTALGEYLSQCNYKLDICHICIAKSLPEDKRYGRSIETNFKVYVDQVMCDRGVDNRTAQAEVMHVLGLSRWQRESELYGIVRDLFPDYKVLREASPEWLGRMRIDIYVPDLGLAVEYQGEQHYRPVTAFGGEDAHSKVVERDRLKRQLCARNNVEVVDFRFDAPITKTAVKSRLRRFLESDQ